MRNYITPLRIEYKLLHGNYKGVYEITAEHNQESPSGKTTSLITVPVNIILVNGERVYHIIPKHECDYKYCPKRNACKAAIYIYNRMVELSKTELFYNLQISRVADTPAEYYRRCKERDDDYTFENLLVAMSNRIYLVKDNSGRRKVNRNPSIIVIKRSDTDYEYVDLSNSQEYIYEQVTLEQIIALVNLRFGRNFAIETVKG